MGKSYDRAFKVLAEDDPRSLLHLFGVVPLDARIEVERLKRKLGLPPLIVDQTYFIRAPGEEWIQHFEAQTRYRTNLPFRFAKYALALALQYDFRLVVRSLLVLLDPRYAPAKIPDSVSIERDELRIRFSYRVVRVWELDPEAVLALDKPALWPWVPLLRPSLPAVKEAARRIRKAGNRLAASDFLTLGKLRYPEDDLARMLGEVGPMILKTVLKETGDWQAAVKEGREEGLKKGLVKGLRQGRQKGIEQGIETGRLQEARRIVQQVLSARFPKLQEYPALDSIEDAKRLEELLNELLRARTTAAARKAIQRAAVK